MRLSVRVLRGLHHQVPFFGAPSRSLATASKEIEFDVFTVNSAGRFSKQTIDLKALRAQTPGLHARDVVSLGILLDSKKQKKTSPRNRKNFTNLLKVRGNILLASFGNIRMILKPTELILFDPHLPNVKSFVSHLSRQLQTNNEHFGLFVLEDLLRDTCDSIDRRLALYNSLLKNIQAEARLKKGKDQSDNILDYSLLSNMLREETNAMHRRSESPVAKLAPLQDLLYEFLLELKDVQSCVVDILNNPYSLSAVNVTANTIHDDAKSDEDNAELVFETYALRLSTSVSGLMQLQQRVKSQLSMADLNLKMTRNRILWLNVNLSAGSLAIGFCSGIMASFGMNVSSGFEMFQYSFYGICGMSVFTSGWVYMRLLRYMRGDFSRAVEASQLAERKFLENVFSDISAVDLVLNSAIREATDDDKAHILNKAEFAQLFAEAKGVDEINQAEVDLVFGLLDVNKDDMLYKSELDLMLHDSDEDDEELDGAVAPIVEPKDDMKTVKEKMSDGKPEKSSDTSTEACPADDAKKNIKEDKSDEATDPNINKPYGGNPQLPGA